MRTNTKSFRKAISIVLVITAMVIVTPIASAATAYTYIPQRLNCSSGTCVSTAVKAPSITNHPSVNGQYYTAVSATVQEQQILSLVNAERARMGLPAYKLDSRLSAIARAKSNDMVKNRYFAHQSPRLGSVRDQIAAAGLSFRCINENIARYGSLSKAMVGLMSSVGHRNNIMSKTYNTIGVGIVQDSSGNYYITQVFVCK